MDSDPAAPRSVAKSSQTPNERRMHPVIARFRSGLREEEWAELDQLYQDAEDNIDLALKTVGFVTDLEKILFAMLLQLVKRIYLIEEKSREKEL